MEVLENTASWVMEQFPGNPVRLFQQLYCLTLAVQVARCLGAHVRFLTWFDSSGLQLARKRGLGAHPSKLYGLFSPPRLSGEQLRITGLALIFCLVASCVPVLPRVFLVLAMLLSLCDFPQMFDETSCSGHSTILIPSLLFILSCSSSLDHEVQSQSEWPLVLIRIYISSGYFSSGMCKLLCGLRFNRYWGKGPTLQMYIFDSMWSRPAGPRVRALQRFLLTSPRLLTVLATCSVLFEVSFVLAPTSDRMCVLCGLNGLVFHAAIALLQGLDFVTFWSPALLAFLVGVPSREPWTAIFTGLESEPTFFLPAALYTVLQVLTALTLRDFWLEDILPFSCCPMFMLPRNPFDEWPKFWTMSEAPINGTTRKPGAMEPLYWSPVSPVFEMSLDEARKLPQRVVWFGVTQHIPAEVSRFIKPECQNKPFLLEANFEISAELKSLLTQAVALSRDGEPSHAWDAARMRRLLDVQDECVRTFYAEVGEARRREKRQ